MSLDKIMTLLANVVRAGHKMQKFPSASSIFGHIIETP